MLAGAALGVNRRRYSLLEFTGDIDVLVEFERGHVPGLAFFTMQEELSALLGRNVDLNTPAGLSPYFRDSVLQEAVTLFGPA